MYDIFTKYIYSMYGQLYMMESGSTDVIFSQSKTDTQFWGYLAYFKYEIKDTVFAFNHKSEIKQSLMAMFGDQYEELLLKYLQERFPESNIIRIG